MNSIIQFNDNKDTNINKLEKTSQINTSEPEKKVEKDEFFKIITKKKLY